MPVINFCPDPNYYSHLPISYRAERFTVQKQRNVRNMDLYRFCRKKGFDIPNLYDTPQPSYEAEKRNIAKYDRLYDPATPESTKHVCDVLLENFGVLPSDQLTVMEALLQFDLTTSVGFPFNLWYKSKREWLQFNDPVQWMELYMLACATYPESSSVIFNSFLKLDEIRLLSKLEQGSVRQINGPHILFLIMQAMLFAKQNAHLKANLDKHPQKIGISLFGHSFRSLLESHDAFLWHNTQDIVAMDSSVGPVYFAGISCWRSFLADDITSFWINHCYRQVAFAPLIDTHGFLIPRLGGNCSGQFNTGEDNSETSTVLAKDFYKSIAVKSLDSAYGDDGISSTDVEIDAIRKEAFYGGRGFKIRDFVQSQNLSDTSFLQRVPFLSKGVWLSKHADGRKCMDSLFVKNPDLLPATQFQRVCGMRIIFFFNDQYPALDAWARHLMEVNSFPIDILSCYLPSIAIERLYAGYEKLPLIHSLGGLAIPGEKTTVSKIT